MNFHEEIKAAVKSSSLIHINDNHRSTIDENSQIPMKAFDDKWIIIQKNTFTNWINEQLKRDEANDEFINDLQNDLCDGVKLVKLINVLQQPNPKIPKKFFKKPINQHQRLENATLALNAITEDGIKLVNIGNTDIASGNLKLILGLVWHLILRYQIGKTKIPPKKLILAWLKAVLPECQINNLTSDLNNGIVLAGLVHYCDAKLLTDWRIWNKNEKLENCRKAMTTAQSSLSIPLVVTPENMSSPELDELSAITYLSYFMKEGSPGYKATLNLIQSILSDEIINNFTTDWNDGWLLCKISSKMGANIPGFPNLDRTKKDHNCQLGVDGCRQLKMETYVTPKELSDPDVESIGIMATLVQFKYIKPPKKANEQAKVNLNSKNSATVGKPLEFVIDYFDGEIKNIKALVKGPNSTPSVGMVKTERGLVCHFVPAESGTHELNVRLDNILLDGCPFFINVKTDASKIQLIANTKFAALYEPIEICVNPMGAGKGRVVVATKSPSNREFSCPVEERDSKYYSKISPTEVGEWRTSVYFDNEEVNGSPYIMDAFDPRSIEISQIRGSNNGIALVNSLISFDVDTSLAGKGTLTAQLLVNNRQTPININKKYTDDTAEKQEIYEINFTPTQPGIHKILLIFNNKQIKGSPVELNVLTEANQVKVLFDKCKSVQVNQLCTFNVETKDNGQGDVKVSISSPNGGHIQAKVINMQNGTWKVEYRPTEVGEFYIDVFYSNQLTNGSPFKSNVFDPSKIKITPNFSGIVGQVVKFEVDASQAGTGQLEIAVENGKIPCNFTNQGNLKFIPAFTPREPGKHNISIKFNGFEVPGSPFICQVVDINRVTLLNYDASRPYKFSVNRQCSIELNANESFNPNINTTITSSTGKSLQITRSITPNGNIRLTFVATEVGLHQLDISYLNTPIAGSPFDIKIYDSSRIIVSDVKGLEINKISEFTIDATNGGEGQLEISINEGLIKNNVKQIKPGLYAVNFLPTKQDYYSVDVKFNGELVPGCPKRVYIKDMQLPKLNGSPHENVIFGAATSFNLSSVSNPSYLDVKIVSPSGEQIIPKIKQLNNEECRIEWTPFQLGTYVINVMYADNVIKGTPLKVKIYDPKKVQVYNIQDGCAFKPNSFCVDASLAGEGSLEIGISCNGHFIPNQVKPLGNSKFEVHFLPQESVIHYANINFNGEPVKDSPFPIKIIDSNSVIAQGKAFGYIPTYIPTTFQILTNGAGTGQVRATVTGPKGENVNVKLFQQPNGDYVAEFIPLSIGQHRIDILFSNQPIAGSPYFSNAYDPNSIELLNVPKDLIVGTENFFEANLTKVGNVDFDVKVTTPSGIQLPVNIEGQNIRKVKFITKEAGVHRISMLLAGNNLPGTPLSLNSIVRLPTARGDGLRNGVEDKPAIFYVDAQGMQGSLDVKIEGPQHYTKYTVDRQSDGLHVVKYTPVEVGLFKIYVQWNGRDISGSPFLSYVVNPDKVRIIGGWQSILDSNNTLNLKINEERVINFDTSEAGPGSLTATIIAPNGNKLPFRLNNQDKIYSLSFTSFYEGDYKIQLFWDGHALPHTPIFGRCGQQLDVSKILIKGNGLKEAKINQESEFVIDGSRAGELFGYPEIKMTGTKTDIDVRIQQLAHNTYRCTYSPHIPGAYLLSIKWNERQIGESPYKVNVGMNSDPSKVIVSGEGIKMGVFGEDIKAIIDTRRAGPGELTANCMGPQKVAFCEFFDHKDGTFTLYVKPQEPGKHILHIKYNGEHVPGSPFVIRISGPPDASKVRVTGPGVTHGVLNKFKSRFVCETKGAGAGQLTVRIRGPKGAFRVEMQRENQKDRTILCKYDPIESGDYQINVKWSNQHVPGSPFNVHIFNTTEELEQFLRANPDEAYLYQQHLNE